MESIRGNTRAVDLYDSGLVCLLSLRDWNYWWRSPGLCCHTNVRWLSFGKVCQQGWQLKADISSFTELMMSWVTQTGFVILRLLWTYLQSQTDFLFLKHISNNSFAHFPTLATLKEAPQHANQYSKNEKSLQLVSCPMSQDSAIAGAAIRSWK